MAKSKRNQEQATDTAPESAAIAPTERATHGAAERRGGDYVPRRFRMGEILKPNRAAPRQKQVRVIRAWPGVVNGQLIVLRPDRQKKLLRAGFIEEVHNDA